MRRTGSLSPSSWAERQICGKQGNRSLPAFSQPYPRLDGTAQYTKYYLVGSERIALRAGSAAVVYLYHDALGSTSATSAGDTEQYYPYGGTRLGGITSTPYRYTGQRAEPTGLYFYGARWYDSSLGRFLQPDTIVPEPGNPQSLNRYSYGLGNPVKYTDPTGHAAKEPDDGGIRDPLTDAQKESAAKLAKMFGIPYELVAATIAVEIVDDTDWIDPILDWLLQEAPLALDFGAKPT